MEQSQRMKNLDRYFLYDHAAKQRTIFISVVTGAAVGIFYQFVGAPMKFAAAACAIATGVVQLVRAAVYIPSPTRKKLLSETHLPCAALYNGAGAGPTAEPEYGSKSVTVVLQIFLQLRLRAGFRQDMLSGAVAKW
jgi:hypothetical protein